MSELNDVAGGETVTAAFTNQVKERTAMRYASNAALDVSVPAPVAGALSYVQDINRLQVFDSNAWIIVTLPGDLAAYLPLVGGTLSGPLVVSALVTANDYQFGGAVGAVKDNLGQNRVILNSAGDVDLAGTDSVSRVSIKDSYGTAVDAASGTARNVLTGTGVPDPGWGKDGDVYLQRDA